MNLSIFFTIIYIFDELLLHILSVSVLISAEAFSPYFVNKECTQTLYKLINDSFVFDNFYTPNFGQSTIGGEFANLTGLFPLWFNGITSAIITKNNYLPFTFSSMTHKMTKNKVEAYHNGRYVVYDRPELYKTWGFDEYIYQMVQD